MSNPFARSLAMSQAIAVLMTKFSGFDLNQAIAALGPYKSRGKGRGKYSGKGRPNPAGKYMPHQGKREMERRALQLAAGRISNTIERV